MGKYENLLAQNADLKNQILNQLTRIETMLNTLTTREAKAEELVKRKDQEITELHRKMRESGDGLLGRAWKLKSSKNNLKRRNGRWKTTPQKLRV